jgi:Tol biopolymer transport system component
MNADGTNQVDLTPGAPSQDPSFAPDGRIAFVRLGSDRDILVAAGDGSNPINVTGPNGRPDQEPDFSPDGKRIVFMRVVSGTPNPFEIVVMDATGGNQTVLASAAPPGGIGSPEFSPDGKRIAFTRGSPGESDIIVMNADGSNPVNLTPEDSLAFDPQFSPDGTRLVFWLPSPPPQGIYMMNVDGTGRVPITGPGAPTGAANPTFSPDGRLLALDGGEMDHDLFTVGVDGLGLTNLTGPSAGDDRSPEWEPIYTCAGRRATIVGSDSDESIEGTKNRDVIVANGGNDRIRGRGGADRICGGNGNDRILGGRGRDRLLGQQGRDILKGGKGDDVLKGGKGKDKEIQ